MIFVLAQLLVLLMFVLIGGFIFGFVLKSLQIKAQRQQLYKKDLQELHQELEVIETLVQDGERVDLPPPSPEALLDYQRGLDLQAEVECYFKTRVFPEGAVDAWHGGLNTGPMQNNMLYIDLGDPEEPRDARGQEECRTSPEDPRGV